MTSRVLRELLSDDEQRYVEFDSFSGRATKLFTDLHDTLQDMGGTDYADVRQVVEDEMFLRAVELILGRLEEAVELLQHRANECNPESCMTCAMEATQS